MYGDFVLIKDINGQTQVDEQFDDYLENGYYVIIDIEALGENIGRELIDECEDELFDEYGDINYTLIYEEIDKRFSNNLIQSVYAEVEEYIKNNL